MSQWRNGIRLFGICLLQDQTFRGFILRRNGNRINSDSLIQRGRPECTKELLLFLGIEVPVREGSSDVTARVTCRQRGILRTRGRAGAELSWARGGGGAMITG